MRIEVATVKSSSKKALFEGGLEIDDEVRGGQWRGGGEEWRLGDGA